MRSQKMNKYEMPLTIEEITMTIIALEATIEDIQCYIEVSKDMDAFEQLHHARCALANMKSLVSQGTGENPQA